MTDPSVDRSFTAWLEERAQPHAPTGLAADVIERTARSRPRPAWRIPERWYSMPTTIRLALVPRGLILFLALWLLLALTVAGAAIGGRVSFTRALLPAPVTGPAANGLIAFQRDGDIWVVEPDGTGERPLITGPDVDAYPVWSPDGTRIAYLSYASPTTPAVVMVANADGTDAITVASVPTGEDGVEQTLDWSPDGSALIFVAISDPAAPCTDRGANGEFCSVRIFKAATDGSTGAVAIGDPDLDARWATWSPDGTAIAFGGGGVREATLRLYLMGPDGTDVRQISTSERASGWSFAFHDWSSDGSQVATQFQSADDSDTEILLVAADGSGDTLITNTPDSEIAPQFAVDGSIGWSGEGEDPCCVQVLEADGGRVALPGDIPYWSPDGSLAVTSTSRLGSDLIVIARDGTIQATITDAGSPNWQRLAP